MRVLSAHRTPKETVSWAETAHKRGIEVIICGAGMAAHLAGAVAAHTIVPVIGVPVGATLGGVDALLSTVQMPKGVPVATVSMGKAGAINAAVLCAEIFSLNNSDLVSKLSEFKKNGCML